MDAIMRVTPPKYLSLHRVLSRYDGTQASVPDFQMLWRAMVSAYCFMATEFLWYEELDEIRSETPYTDRQRQLWRDMHHSPAYAELRAFTTNIAKDLLVPWTEVVHAGMSRGFRQEALEVLMGFQAEQLPWEVLLHLFRAWLTVRLRMNEQGAGGLPQPPPGVNTGVPYPLRARIRDARRRGLGEYLGILPRDEEEEEEEEAARRQ
jgi:hypothetical protein